ncbi:MAG TPA: NCS2 family permease [Actinomycetota bacterium]|nr:NCS2 family permease [Actinomycetota bacterium]
MASTTSSPSPARRAGADGPLDRYFRISERGSSLRTELIAGVATWLTMAYILFVNPAILGTLADPTGTTLPFPAVLTATALVAGVMTLLMGVVANYPFALAAGLGLNAFVTFTLVGTLGLTWPAAMGVIVIEGLLITALVLTGFREAVLNAIPMDLKRAIGIGIGLFIAFIGLVNAGIVVHPEAGEPIVTLNPDLTTLRILTFAIGMVITAALVARRTRGALLIGILVTTAVAAVINAVWGGGRVWADLPGVARLPEQLVAAPDFSLVGRFSITGVFEALPVATAIAAIISVMLSDFFDTMGTVIGIGGEARLLDEEGRLPGMNRVLLVDSVAAAAGGAASASSNTTFIESAAGVSEGGRTGLTSVVVAALFFLALFLSPWAGVIPPEATAPVLVIVGYFMMTLVREIEWGDPAIGIPALLTVAVMPFTFSITNGVAAGFLAYTVITVLAGRWRQVHWLMYLVSAVFVWYFVEGLVA